MPALQVRDFPETLYDELKAFAAANHRSMSQQVIVAVEEMLAAAAREAEAQAADKAETAFVSEGAFKGDFQIEIPASLSKTVSISELAARDTEEARQARIEKRKKLFARIHEMSKRLPEDLPDPVEMVRESRRERDERLMHVLAETGIGVEP